MPDLKLYPLLKYYKGENEPPTNFNDIQKMWWAGERQFFEEAKNDKNFISRWKKKYYEAMKAGYLNGKLIDTEIEETKRLIIFYLDLWHGKWFPYDNLDLIFEY